MDKKGLKFLSEKRFKKSHTSLNTSMLGLANGFALVIVSQASVRVCPLNRVKYLFMQSSKFKI